MKNDFWEHILYFKGVAPSYFVDTIADDGFACHMTAKQCSEPSPLAVISCLILHFQAEIFRIGLIS